MPKKEQEQRQTGGKARGRDREREESHQVSNCFLLSSLFLCFLHYLCVEGLSHIFGYNHKREIRVLHQGETVRLLREVSDPPLPKHAEGDVINIRRDEHGAPLDVEVR